MNYRLVVFDMAGTTVRDLDEVNACFRQTIDELGLDVDRDKVNAYMGVAKPLHIRKILEAIGETEDLDTRIDAIHASFVRRMVEYYETSDEVVEVPGASEVFRALREAGIRIALDTGFSRAIARVVIDRLGWERDGLIDASVTSDEVANGRPHPDLIFRAMELTGITDVKSVVKVGDTPADLNQGTEAGCARVIGVTEGTHTRSQLLEHPHTDLISSVADLPALLLGQPSGV